jgi:hypothetical protein
MMIVVVVVVVVVVRRTCNNITAFTGLLLVLLLQIGMSRSHSNGSSGVMGYVTLLFTVNYWIGSCKRAKKSNTVKQ